MQITASGPSGKFCNAQPRHKHCGQGAVRREWQALSKGCNTAHDACGAALREPLCECDSVLRFLPREGPLPAKRALIRTRTVALNVTELSTWPTSNGSGRLGQRYDDTTLKKSLALLLCCALALSPNASAYSVYGEENPFVEAMLRMMEIFGLINRDRLALGVPYLPAYGGLGGLAGTSGLSPLGGLGGVPGYSPLGGFGGVPGLSPFSGFGGVPGLSPLGGLGGVPGVGIRRRRRILAVMP